LPTQHDNKVKAWQVAQPNKIGTYERQAKILETEALEIETGSTNEPKAKCLTIFGP